jgi:hypothetical protein
MDISAGLACEPLAALRPLRTDRATKVQAAVLALVMLINVWVMTRMPSRIQFSQYWLTPLPSIVATILLALLCRRLGLRRCGLFFAALAWVAASGLSEVQALYAVALSGSPLADDWLLRFDAALGFSTAGMVEWIGRHHWLDTVLATLYEGIFIETILVILILSALNDRKALVGFVLQFMLCEPVLLLVFYVYPAAGPFATQGFAPTPAQHDYLTQFTALRGTENFLVTHPTGLVTFPSFHTTWALMLAYALRHHRGFFRAGLLVNGLIVVSTMTTGWHYLADVLGGIALALVVIALSARLVLEPLGDGETRDSSHRSGPICT